MKIFKISALFLVLVFSTIFVTMCAERTSDEFLDVAHSDGPNDMNNKNAVSAISIAYIYLREYCSKVNPPISLDEFRSPDFPPDAAYGSKRHRWDVFFTNGASTVNIELDEKLLKGTVIRMDGVIYTSVNDETVDTKNPPLFTIEEFRKIINEFHVPKKLP